MNSHPILVENVTPEEETAALKRLSPKEFRKPIFLCDMHPKMYKSISCGTCENGEFICMGCFVKSHMGHILIKRTSVADTCSSDSNKGAGRTMYYLRSSDQDKDCNSKKVNKMCLNVVFYMNEILEL
jgi:hypothetical protein